MCRTAQFYDADIDEDGILFFPMRKAILTRNFQLKSYLL